MPSVNSKALPVNLKQLYNSIASSSWWRPLFFSAKLHVPESPHCHPRHRHYPRQQQCHLPISLPDDEHSSSDYHTSSMMFIWNLSFIGCLRNLVQDGFTQPIIITVSHTNSDCGILFHSGLCKHPCPIPVYFHNNHGCSTNIIINDDTHWPCAVRSGTSNWEHNGANQMHVITAAPILTSYIPFINNESAMGLGYLFQC